MFNLINRFSVTCIMLCMVTLASCSSKKPASSGTVVILNGPSAVGKSSIIRAFQNKRSEPWLGIGIDNFFVGVLPAKFYLEDKPEHHVVMQGVASQDSHGKLFTLKFGPEGEKVIRGMHRAIAAYAQQGNNVIVDYISYDQAWLDDLRKALAGIDVITVGITASLETIEAREKGRKTSPEGHARSHYDSVHQGWSYNLELNTDTITPEAAADKIVSLLEERKYLMALPLPSNASQELGAHVLKHKSW